jgi:cysteine desulfurase/selenocysteine lyase
VHDHEIELTKQTLTGLSQIQGVKVIGPLDIKDRGGVVSFTVDGLHPFDIGTLLDKQGIAVRTGHHCTQPLMDFYKIPGTVRASFAFYNTKQEIDTFVAALEKSIAMLK